MPKILTWRHNEHSSQTRSRKISSNTVQSHLLCDDLSSFVVTRERETIGDGTSRRAIFESPLHLSALAACLPAGCCPLSLPMFSCNKMKNTGHQEQQTVPTYVGISDLAEKINLTPWGEFSDNTEGQTSHSEQRRRKLNI